MPSRLGGRRGAVSTARPLSALCGDQACRAACSKRVHMHGGSLRPAERWSVCRASAAAVMPHQPSTIVRSAHTPAGLMPEPASTEDSCPCCSVLSLPFADRTLRTGGHSRHAGLLDQHVPSCRLSCLAACTSHMRPWHDGSAVHARVRAAVCWAVIAAAHTRFLAVAAICSINAAAALAAAAALHQASARPLECYAALPRRARCSPMAASAAAAHVAAAQVRSARGVYR